MRRTMMSPVLFAYLPIVLFTFDFAQGAEAKPESEVPFSDERVQQAIDRGKKFLYSRQQDDGSWGDANGGLNVEGNDRKIGLAGLATYALLAGGESVQDPRIEKAFRFMDEKTQWTYALAFRTQALLEASRQNPKYRQALAQDAKLLIMMAADKSKKAAGSYEYKAGVGRDGDLSNSQYGLLGVWAAVMAGAEVPRAYWEVVMKYWVQTQRKDGGWSYKYRENEESGATMTSAGIASLFVCVDAIYAQRFISCGRDPEIPPIQKGLEWFEKNFAKAMTDNVLRDRGHGDMYYFLFGVERIGLASGYKYFGDQDWYRTGTAWLLSHQDDDGSFREGKWGSTVSTAYALLFLIRGQQPIIANRLEYNGDWNNRPRALASLCRWARDAFERDVNWQIVNLKTSPEDWHDAPLLLITGSKKPTFTEQDLDKLRTFVEQGGTLMSVTECNGNRQFGEGMREIYATLFPDYPMQPVPAEHPFYNIHAKLKDDAKLQMVHNGIRPWVIHTDEDLAKAWQLGQFKTQRRDFDPIANILIYITGHQFQNRGTMIWPSQPKKVPPAPIIHVARVKHAGNWNPEPLALERFRRMMARQDLAKIELLDPVDLGALDQCKANLAVMTGTDMIELSDDQLAKIKAYSQAGGTLMIDAAHGNDAFYNTIYEALNRTFENGVIALPVDSPVYIHGNINVGEIALRGNRIGAVQRGRPKLEAVTIDKRPAIILSRHDITGGLLGVRVIDCEGYVPQSAFEIMRNVALYTLPQSKGNIKGWSNTDIGTVAKAGSFTISNGATYIKASGNDIWNNSDACHYVSRKASGDVTITARVTGIEKSHEWAKAGVMLRQSLDPSSKNVMVALTPSHGVTFQTRQKEKSVSANEGRGEGSAPYWVRLVRSGDAFSGYASADGSNWTNLGSATVSMNKDVYVGLVVTSHNDDTLCTATFDNITIKN